MKHLDSRTVGVMAKAATSLHLLAENLLSAPVDDQVSSDLWTRTTELRDSLEAIITKHLEATS